MKKIILNTNQSNNNSQSLFTALANLVIFLAGFNALAANADSQYWTSIQASVKIDSNWSLVGEYINRYSDDAKDWVVRSNRLGFSYKFENGWSYSLQSENRDTNSNANNEIRLINQASKTWKADNYDLTFRGRFELREFGDTAVIQNRIRLLARADFKYLKYGIFTPASSAEYFRILNEVTASRPSGSTETRLQFGGAFDVGEQKVDLFYLARQQYRPENNGVESKTSFYNVINVVYKLSF